MGDKVKDNVVELLATRLVNLLKEASAVCLYAPPEFLPVQVVHKAIDLTGEGEQWRDLEFLSSADIEENLEILRGSERLFLSFPISEKESLDSIIAKYSFTTIKQKYLIVAAEYDGVMEHPQFEKFEFVLKSSALLLTAEDIENFLPRDSRTSRHARDIIEITGGIPALVVAMIEDIKRGIPPASGVFLLPMVEVNEKSGALVVAKAWAERNLERVMKDDVTNIHAWVAPLKENAMMSFISKVYGYEVTREKIARVRGVGSTVSLGREGIFAFPPILAEAFTTLARKEFPQESRELRKKLIFAASDEDMNISALDRVITLTLLGAWDVLNRVLGASMLSLISLTHDQRTAFVKMWPEEIPSEWKYLSAAKELFSGAWEKNSRELPLPWLELVYLASSSNRSKFPPIFQALYPRALSAVAVAHKSDKDYVCQELFEIRDYLFTMGRQAMFKGSSTSTTQAQRDEVTVYGGILLGLADCFLSVGELTEAQNCVNLAGSLLDVCKIDIFRAPALRIALTGRVAMFSAKAGMKEHAQETIRVYENFVHLLGEGDPEPDQLIRIARRFLAPSLENFHEEKIASVPFDTQFSPVEVEAEAYILLLTRGPMTAAQYVQAFLGRAGWADLQPWEWWPLYSFLAMLEVREGRNDRVRTWLDFNYLPRAITRIVEAGVALNEGRKKESAELVEGVLSSPALSDRWRLVACGLLLLSLEKEAEVNAVLVSLQNQWTRNLAMVAIMPNASRKLIGEKLSEELQRLPGIVSEHNREDSSDEEAAFVKLTPRQYDVLRGLAEGKTLASIAKELYLGVETIRSTTKALYKRMGVHDRHAAVELAYELKIL